MARPRKGISDADRVVARIRVNPETQCWEWQGYRMPAGHGRFRAEGRKVLVHVWVYARLVGPIPDGLELDHLCRVPFCCNPDHLEAVTHRENVLRGVGAGALNAAKVECPKGHPYSPDNTYVDSLGRRVCRACRAAWQRRYRATHRPQTARDGGPGCPGTVGAA